MPSSCSSLPPSPSPTVMPTSNRQSRQPASSTDLTLRCHSRLTRGCHSWHICCDWNGKASKGHQSSAFLKPCLLDLKSRHPTHSHQPRTRGVCVTVAGPAPTHNKFNQRVPVPSLRLQAHHMACGVGHTLPCRLGTRPTKRSGYDRGLVGTNLWSLGIFMSLIA